MKVKKPKLGGKLYGYLGKATRLEHRALPTEAKGRPTSAATKARREAYRSQKQLLSERDIPLTGGKLMKSDRERSYGEDILRILRSEGLKTRPDGSFDATEAYKILAPKLGLDPKAPENLAFEEAIRDGDWYGSTDNRNGRIALAKHYAPNTNEASKALANTLFHEMLHRRDLQTMRENPRLKPPHQDQHFLAGEVLPGGGVIAGRNYVGAMAEDLVVDPTALLTPHQELSKPLPVDPEDPTSVEAYLLQRLRGEN